MMEYTSTYWNMLMPLIKPCLKKKYGKSYTQKLVRKADAVYRDLLNREYTLAGGGEVCDYWYVGDRLKDPK